MLRKSEAGRLVAITSSVGRNPRAFWGAYGASKAALETLVLSYGEEVRNIAPIRTAIVDPGSTATTMRARTYPGEDTERLKQQRVVADGTMMRRKDQFDSGNKLDSTSSHTLPL